MRSGRAESRPGPSICSRWLRQYRIDQGEALPVDRGLLNTSERDELIKL